MLATVLLSSLTATAAMLAPDIAAPEPRVEFVQADCNAAAQRVVAQTGGQLLSVSQGPDGTCNVTVLVPSQDNGRRTKTTISVPPS